MNAAEFASRLLDLVASAVPDDVPISKRLEAEIDTLIDEFTAPPEPVLKFDEDRRMVYGWASVISKNGQTIIDRQGDVVTADDLREAVHDFMKHRTAGEMHDQMGVGEVVESFVLDAAVQKSLGIDLGMEGWYVGVHVPNDEVWAKVKKGDYKAFSIGGSAVREPISDEDSKDFLLAKGYKAINDGSPSEDGACPACGKKHAKGKCVKKGGYGKMCKDCGKKCGPDGKCGCMKKFNPNHGPDGRFASGGGMRGAGRGSRSAGAKLTGGKKPGKGDPKRLGGSRVTGVRRDSDGRKMYDTKDLEGIPAGQTKKPVKGGGVQLTEDGKKRVREYDVYREYKGQLDKIASASRQGFSSAELAQAKKLGLAYGNKMREYKTDIDLRDEYSRSKDVSTNIHYSDRKRSAKEWRHTKLNAAWHDGIAEALSSYGKKKW